MSSRQVIIDYTNWRGERALRTIEPIALRFGETKQHPGGQWLLEARDVEKDAQRTFAMGSIHTWGVSFG